jgi:hypothetical protein
MKRPPVESIPAKASGAWVFKGTRLLLTTVIESGETEPAIGFIIAAAHAAPMARDETRREPFLTLEEAAS